MGKAGLVRAIAPVASLKSTSIKIFLSGGLTSVLELAIMVKPKTAERLKPGQAGALDGTQLPTLGAKLL